MQHSVNVCLNLNTSYKNVYASDKVSPTQNTPALQASLQIILKQTARHSFYWKKLKGFISCSKNSVLFIYSLSEPSRSKRPGMDTKKKYKRNKKRWEPCFGLPEFIEIN